MGRRLPRRSRAALSDTSIIVGLGNPGPRYQGTRHNIGFHTVDLLARKWGVAVNERRPKAVLGRGVYEGNPVVLAKPRTFMNNSGEAVSYLLTRFSANRSDLLIVYDEMALPLGRMRLRPDGGDAGHNGIRSIIQAVGGIAFPRLRIGIGPPSPEDGAVDHVLSGFSEDESRLVDETVDRAVAAVECLLQDGIDTAMNRFN